MDNVKAIFQNIIDFISNVFSGNWSAAWQNIVNIFGNLFGMIVNLAKAPINGVISAINWVLSKINSISVTIPDWVPGVGGKTLGFNIPTIPQLAEGGRGHLPHPGRDRRGRRAGGRHAAVQTGGHAGRIHKETETDRRAQTARRAATGKPSYSPPC